MSNPNSNDHDPYNYHRPNPYPPLQPSHSFHAHSRPPLHHRPPVNFSGELRIPPPHSDTFFDTYGRHDEPKPSSGYPMADLLNEMRISDPVNAPAPVPPHLNSHWAPGRYGYPGPSKLGPSNLGPLAQDSAVIGTLTPSLDANWSSGRYEYQGSSNLPPPGPHPSLDPNWSSGRYGYQGSSNPAPPVATTSVAPSLDPNWSSGRYGYPGTSNPVLLPPHSTVVTSVAPSLDPEWSSASSRYGYQGHSNPSPTVPNFSNVSSTSSSFDQNWGSGRYGYAPGAMSVPQTPSSSCSTPFSLPSHIRHNSDFGSYPGSAMSAPQTPSSGSSTPFSLPQRVRHDSEFGGSPVPTMQITPFDCSKVSLKVLLLHGNLDIWVRQAVNLPNMDMFSKTLGDMLGTLNGKINSKHMPNITSDPYVSISVASAVIARTYVISNNENPVWDQHFYVPVAHNAAEVHFVVKDSDIIGSELIGTVSIPAEHIYSGEKVEGWFSILDSNGKECKKNAALKLSIQYIPMEAQSTYLYGGVPGTYFPVRENGRVRLYQDAHVPDGCLPDLWTDNGMSYQHGKCWKDICDAIIQAQRLIYITGWSVYHEVQLVRDFDQGSGETLGDLLRSKSQEGVRVLLLVWDDPTSRSILGYQKEGVMATHDEETRRFFKHSSVRVLLCPRSAGKRLSWAKQQEVGIIYTHHQKTVIVDSEAGNNKRQITAFVGGLDLCDGRYDTPQHPLFRTLQTTHKEDNHNPTFVGINNGGPREPWHDLHSRIDGPAAYDVLKNFEERWLKASKPRGIKKLKKPYDDTLIKLERVPDIMNINEAKCYHQNDPETWHVQIFRSIDSDSVKGFPKDPTKATKENLVCGKNVLIDMSIHTAYVKAIRAAQHFIYIENQYFLGSSYNWKSHNDLGANNLIPMEIALKIANKIKSNERFSVYIVIPMWPEGNPTGAPTQRILYWQNKTMQMMYEVIYNALVEAGLQHMYEPQDYLNFFCLGNREALDGSLPFVNPTNPNAANTPSVLAQKNRRFMIYVHSKGMIVDDEYLIIGSANINQRSLEGTRDTEIAMGAYQPKHTWERKMSSPCGQIHAYRMSLWAEHTGVLEECFRHPESLECIRRIRKMGEINWDLFISDTVTEMRGHLLKYPVDVDKKGKVKPLSGCETFPDVGGNICGSFVAVQENLTI